MWSFKKKSRNIEIATPVVESIICIPGCWKSAAEIFGLTEGKLMLVGGSILMDVKNKIHFKAELDEKDESMRKSFEVAGKVTGVSDLFLNEIETHISVLYITAETGNFSSVRSLAKVALELLEAGGIGIKVETAGKAFEKVKWKKLVDAGNDADLYQLFVVDSIMAEDGTTFSCGMHNIGYRDVIISGLEFQEAHRLVSMFNYHRIIDKPIIKTGETFSLDMNSPIYFITNENKQPYDKNDLFYNPFGMWRLVKAEEN